MDSQTKRLVQAGKNHEQNTDIVIAPVNVSGEGKHRSTTGHEFSCLVGLIVGNGIVRQFVFSKTATMSQPRCGEPGVGLCMRRCSNSGTTWKGVSGDCTASASCSINSRDELPKNLAVSWICRTPSGLIPMSLAQVASAPTGSSPKTILPTKPPAPFTG